MEEEGSGRSCGITRDLQKLKQQAMAYYQENDVPRRLEELLNSTFYLQPADVYGHLANYFSKLAKPPSICKVAGKIILDGLGLPTLQVEISCTIQNLPKYICSVVIPAHFEVPENAPPEVADAEETERHLAVSTALQWVNECMTEELCGLVPSNQAEVDHRLRLFFENKVQEDKERKELERSLEESVPVPPPVILPPPPPPPTKKKGQKPGRRDTLLEKPIIPPEPPEPILHGSMAIGAVSLAVAKTSASLASVPLYMNIASLKHGQVSEGCTHLCMGSGTRPCAELPFSLSSASLAGAAVSHDTHHASADGICAQLREGIAREAKLNEGSDLHPPSWINNQTST